MIGRLTTAPFVGPLGLMATPTDQNFIDYKKAEKKALEIVAAMKTASPKKGDIEVALVVALFELHKGTIPAESVASIVQGHLKALLPFYTASAESRT